ncbi:MAG: hypothetical protein AMXMBFR6_17570 [Betaproteobacteria bacterium]
MRIDQWLSRNWQARGAFARLSYPVAAGLGVLVALRRRLYASGLLATRRLPVPVVVIGSIYVGGTGKTPLVLWLARRLGAHGLRVGLISRGHGRTGSEARLVERHADPAEVGDEPALLARDSACPVAVGADRHAAGRLLLDHDPNLDLILTDDGLQHYRLARDIELCVLDGRGLGNGWLLPAGPLREPASRLASVGALVLNGTETVPAAAAGRPVFGLRLVARELYRLQDEHRVEPLSFLKGRRVHALAGIGDPQRFFAQLRALGAEVLGRALPDHHRYRREDLAFGDARPIVMTEKDAIKCHRFDVADAWVLRVDAEVAPIVAGRTGSGSGHPNLDQWIIESLYGPSFVGHSGLPGVQESA